MAQTMLWKGDSLELLDQTKLPLIVEYISCTGYERVGEAIQNLEVRGAPAIGAAAAFAFVLGVKNLFKRSPKLILPQIEEIDAALRQTRPTAVNLFWALDRMLNLTRRLHAQGEAPEEICVRLEKEACWIAEKDRQVNQKLSAYGAALFQEPTAFLTHCNAGALATVGVGTALGVIRAAWAQGNVKRVFADETRPLLQGARLTAFELLEDKIPVTLLTDNMAGWAMKKGLIDAVIVGADRIAANGDAANKIGTYSVAVLAKEHQIPFYVAAPVSTFDFSMESGAQIPIEERKKEEVTSVFGTPVAPQGVDVFNPAFDVTPHALVCGIITEYGVLRPDYVRAIQVLQEQIKENEQG